MPTFKELFKRKVDLQHRLAVWEAIHSFLEDGFTSKDGRKAPKAIRVPDCPVEVVSEETVEDVLQFISENNIQEIQAEIARVDGQELSSATPQEPS